MLCVFPQLRQNKAQVSNHAPALVPLPLLPRASLLSLGHKKHLSVACSGSPQTLLALWHQCYCTQWARLEHHSLLGKSASKSCPGSSKTLAILTAMARTSSRAGPNRSQSSRSPSALWLLTRSGRQRNWLLPPGSLHRLSGADSHYSPSPLGPKVAPLHPLRQTQTSRALIPSSPLSLAYHKGQMRPCLTLQPLLSFLPSPGCRPPRGWKGSSPSAPQWSPQSCLCSPR